MQRLDKIYVQKAALKMPEWRSYCNFGKVTKNPCFLKKCKGRTQENFKKKPKSKPRLKGPKALWRKLHYTLISIQLKWKDWRRFWCKRRIQNCPNGQVMANFARLPKSRIFENSAKGGPKEIFQKSPKKKPSIERPKSTEAPDEDIVQNHLT